MNELLGDAITLVLETIEEHINYFFVQALQLDQKPCGWRLNKSMIYTIIWVKYELRNFSKIVFETFPVKSPHPVILARDQF